MKKKIRYSELAAPEPPAAPSAEASPPPASSPSRRISAPVDIARALASAHVPEESEVAETLAEVEARAAAAHARALAAAEAGREAVPVPSPLAAEPAVGELTRPAPGRVSLYDEYGDDDDEDEDAYDDRWDDEEYAHHHGPRRSLRERARGRLGTVELLMFRVGTERFAVELACVEEAIDLPEVHHVPEMPPAMLGVITVRGAITPVFTAQEALGVPVEGRSAALVFRTERGRFALAIDDVDDVLSLDLATLRDAPGVDGTDGVVLGVARQEGAIVALVDAEALVASCQAIPVPELT